MASYSAFAIAFGSGIFTGVAEDSCDSVGSCLDFVFDLVGALLTLITLGGLTDNLPILFRGVLLLALFLGWGTYLGSLTADAV